MREMPRRGAGSEILKESRMKINRFILGSGSTFRAEVLRSLGIVFSVEAPWIDEDKIQGSDPADIALGRAMAKARAVSELHQAAIVLGADQTVGFEGHCLGKAGDRNEARDQLRALSGRTHHLHSAFCLYAHDSDKGPVALCRRVVSVPMTMRNLSEEEIECYLDTLEWQGCAGCYRFEARGGQLFVSAGGTNADIIGLPIISLSDEMRRIGINPLVNPQGPWLITPA